MIPLPKDTREAIGTFAERVENRGLLFEKMVLSKNWGHDVRFNDANRFNVLRAVTGGAERLQEDREEADRKVRNPRSKDEVKRENAYKAKVAGALASVKVDNPKHVSRQAENAAQLLRYLEKSYASRSRTFVAALGGRLLINLAGGVMENAGIALDRCFGLPYIPGTAVKGAARSAALWDIKRTKDEAEQLDKARRAMLAFGFIDQDLGEEGDFTWALGDSVDRVQRAAGDNATHSAFQGLIAFLPSYPVDAKSLKLVAEVQTPHPRAGSHDDPCPLFFPAVKAGSRFGFGLVMHRTVNGVEADSLLDAAAEWLKEAIMSEGLGAKTGSGFGWFCIDEAAERERRERMQAAEQEEAKAREAADRAEEDRIEREQLLDSLPAHERRAAEMKEAQLINESAIADFGENLSDKDPKDQHAFCYLLSSDLSQKWRSWKKKNAKRWANRVEPIREIAKKYGIELP